MLATYRGQELNHIVTEHPWDTAVDELVILGDHVTTDSGTGIVHTAPGFGEDDYNVGIANGLEVAVTVNERGIMMANAGEEFEGQFYDKVVPTVIEKLGNLLLAQEEISHSYPFDWRTKKNQSSGVPCHNGLLLYLNSVKKSWMKLKKSSSTQSGVKSVCTI